MLIAMQAPSQLKVRSEKTMGHPRPGFGRFMRLGSATRDAREVVYPITRTHGGARGHRRA